MSKWLSGKGSFSASHCAAGASTPSSSRRSRPTPSMALLMSVSQTWPVGADTAGESAPTGRRCRRRRRARARPVARRDFDGEGSSTGDADPADMRSFITSYFCATDEKTPATRRAFSSSSTVSKPKWVCVIGQWLPQPPDLGGCASSSLYRGWHLLFKPLEVVSAHSASWLAPRGYAADPRSRCRCCGRRKRSAARRSCRPARAR
jgi:hypothetical protein